MISARVVQTSVANNCSFQKYPHPEVQGEGISGGDYYDMLIF